MAAKRCPFLPRRFRKSSSIHRQTLEAPMRRRDLLKTGWTLSTAATLGLVAAGLMLSQQRTGAQQSQIRRVDDGALRNAGANGEEWLTYGLDPGEKRFSPLTQ